MAGVPTFTESPINAAVDESQPSNTTTGSTAPAPTQTTVPPTTTAPPAQATSPASPLANRYMPAQPGAIPPIPTAAANPQEIAPTPTQTQAPIPTRTSSTPPPPQPGHLPTPSVSKSRSPSPRRDIPPPPKVGEKMKPVAYYSPQPTPTYASTQSPHPSPYPPQFGMAPISDPRAAGGQPPASATSFDGGQRTGGLLSPQSAYGGSYSPAQTPTGERRSFDHPQGYSQNSGGYSQSPGYSQGYEQNSQYSQDNMTQGQTTPGGGMFSGFNRTASPGPGTPGRGAGILNGDGKSEDNSVMGMMGGWAKSAGKMLGQLENEAWKRINKE